MIILTRALRGRPAQRGNGQGGFVLTNHTERDWIIYSPSHQTLFKNTHTHTVYIFVDVSTEQWCRWKSVKDKINTTAITWASLWAWQIHRLQHFRRKKREWENHKIWNSLAFSSGRMAALSPWSIFRHKPQYSITPNTPWLKEIRFIETLIDATRL